MPIPSTQARHVVAVLGSLASFVALTLLFSYTLTGCMSSNLSPDLSPQQLSADERYEVNFITPPKGFNLEYVLKVAKESGYWVRVGHEPDVDYYKGNEVCTTCEYQQQGEFFQGDRVYVDPVDSTFAVYRQTQDAEIKLLGNDSSITDVHIQLYADKTNRDVEEMVTGTLDRFGQQEAYTNLKMTFQRLPKDRLR